MDKGLQQPGGGPREDLISPGPRQEKWVGEALQAVGTVRLDLKAKLINFYFWPFLSLCPISALVASDVSLGF